MYRIRNCARGIVAAGALLAAACAPIVPPTTSPPTADGLPPIPMVEGPLDIRVIHPTASTARPSVDSTLIYGSVGNGRATLLINGSPVQVAPNGAFLAYLPVPANGTYELRAELGGRSASATRAYRPPPTATAATTPLTTVDYPAARSGVVVGGADTLRTGSDVAIGRTAPSGGSFRWFLPRGARVAVTGERGDMLRVRMDTATAWFPAADLRVEGTEPSPARGAIGEVRVAPAEGWVDIRIAAGAAPFHVQAETERLVLTLYDRTPPPAATRADDPLLAGIEWRGGDRAQAEIRLTRGLWGYKAFYAADGDLVIRLRRPPSMEASQPLRGLRIVVDPGHPPAGATGPTGLTEAEANLAIGLRLAAMLRERGAQVVMTRTSSQPLVSATDASAELRARTALAVDSDAHLYVSVHNNAFPEGVNPFRSNGTSTYYYHPFSAGFARLMNEELVSTTRLRDLGHRSGNLAVVRPTWFPSILTESLFMPVPEQESALRDAGFVERLAAAHVLGIERFLRMVVND